MLQFRGVLSVTAESYRQGLRLCSRVHLEHQYLEVPTSLGRKPGLYLESDKVSAVYNNGKIRALEVSIKL